MSTVVVVKYPNDDRYVTLNFQDVMSPSETITSATISSISPAGLDVSLGTFATPTVSLKVGAGVDGLSYGVNVTIVTSLPRTVTRTVAVVINSQMAYTHATKNPEAFVTLIGTLEAGQAAIGIGNFNFPLSVNPQGGYVTWELIDIDGTIYSNGNAFDFVLSSSGVSNRVAARAVINCPSELAGSLAAQKYQIRWKLQVNGQEYFSFENVNIEAVNSVPFGAEDTLELAGDNAQLSLVLDRPYEKVGLEIYRHNTKMMPFVEVLDKTKTADGWQYRGIIATAQNYLPAMLEPYNVIWSYYNTSTQTVRERQTGRLFVVNPSLLTCIDDMRIMVNKSHSSISGAPDIVFTSSLLLAYLRRGRDYFNGAWGMLTAFDMTNATGGIREFWLRASEVMALRAQYLAEGEKAFNFSGQAISLDVDHSQFYQTLADTMQSGLDSELKPFKQNLIKKGIIAGDGDLTSVAARPGSIGAIGITISPASNFGALTGRFSGGRGF